MVASMLHILGFLLLSTVVSSEDRFFNWNITYGNIYPLGIPQQGILINEQFPGPDIHSFTEDNLIINIQNSLSDPFLMSWNGIQHRKNSYEDGVYGTTCPIPPGQNFTYIMQLEDQIGSFFYFPSLAFHKAAGGFGGIRIHGRPEIPIPFPNPAADYTILIGDWYQSDHNRLKAILDGGNMLHFPDSILINGRGPNGATFNFQQENIYRLRISNVGLQNSLNFQIQGHEMTLVEVEGTHTEQISVSSIDVHVGQSYSVLVTADQPIGEYYIVVSTRFTTTLLNTTAIIRYDNSAKSPLDPLPLGPSTDIDWSLNQALSIRTNLTANDPRQSPQGLYNYGTMNIMRTIKIANSATQVNGMRRYTVNNVSFVPADTPLKLADYFKIGGVFGVGSIPDNPTDVSMHIDTSVMSVDFGEFVEVVFENDETLIQSWHLDGYSFFVVGMGKGVWSPENREKYNLRDAVSRCTTQVYPKSWTVVYILFDNVGMWNMRSEDWARQYLGQQFYVRVNSFDKSIRYEYPIPENALLCGRAIEESEKHVIFAYISIVGLTISSLACLFYCMWPNND